MVSWWIGCRFGANSQKLAMIVILHQIISSSIWYNALFKFYYEVVQSFPPIEQNYSKVIESLKPWFGKDDLLVEVYVRELLKIVLQNSISNKIQISLQTLYDKLESYLPNLETLGVTSHKCACILCPMVEPCMPEEMLRAWQRSSFRTGDLPQDRLKNIMKFMLIEVDNEQRICLALSGFGIKRVKTFSSSKEKPVKNTFCTNKVKSNRRLQLLALCLLVVSMTNNLLVYFVVNHIEVQIVSLLKGCC